MNYINTIEEMTKILQEQLEVVLCGYNSQSKSIIDFFKKKDMQRRISCIATLNEYNSKVMEVYEDKAVFYFEDLEIFWKTAVFVICDINQNHIAWIDKLQSYGCRKIFVMRDNLYTSVQDLLKADYSWKLDRLSEELNEMKLMITEQNEVCALHKETFSLFENCFADRDVVIVGTGPSVQYYHPISNAVHIGLNQAWRKQDVAFDFLFAQDAATCKRDLIVEGFDKIKRTVFMGKYFRRFKDNWIEFSERYSHHDKVKRYFTDASEGGASIYKNLLFHPLRDYYGVAFPALNFALFTHPKRLFLVGLDTSSGRVNHFYDSKDISFAVSGILKAGYLKYKKFAAHQYPDVEIYSINPVGLKGLFRDIYTDDYPNHEHIRHLIPELEIRISKNSRIALYGAGDQGKRFYEILRNAENINICNWVDKKYERIGFPVNNPESLRNLGENDYVLIAIEREDVVSNVKRYLMEMGISQERIIWFPDTPQCG